MPFQQSNHLRYFIFDTLADCGVKHAVFTRQGGSSPAPWDSLNVGGTVGDDPARVVENRQRSFRALNRPVESIFDVWQVHSSRVICADSPRPKRTPYRKADAILTDQPHVTLFMRFADCVPILLVDPVRKVVGLAHAGWQGTVKKVAASAVKALTARYGSSPADLMAGIGPSIAAHHYDVGPEVVGEVQRAFGVDASGLLRVNNGSPDGSGVQFDLWEANRLTLWNAGVRQIEISGLCTACSLGDWYSHRAEKGRTGRFGALIAL